MREFKHKITGIKGELLEDGHLHFNRTGGDESCHETIWFGFIENSQDWEEIEQPYWELLRYSYDNTAFAIKRENGRYLCEKSEVTELQQGATFEQVLDFWSSRHAIHSIKRLSDGVIFNVGDTVICNEKYIKKINCINFYQEKHLIFNFENTSDNFTTESEWDRMQPKMEEPLFTTEDGVDIFENDTVTWLHSDNLSIANTGKAHKSMFLYLKYFSTREIAEQWILQNEKKYSLNDVEDAIRRYKGQSRVPRHTELDILNFLENEQPSK